MERAAVGTANASSETEAVNGRRRGDATVDDDPLVRKVVELFEARRLHLDYDEQSPPTTSS